MRFVSLDVETTGLNSEKCQILEIGAIVEDSMERHEIKNLPRYHKFVTHPAYYFEPVALKMNWHIMNAILFGGEDHIPRIEGRLLPVDFYDWLVQQGFELGKGVTFVGKNFNSFDRRFLESGGFLNVMKIKHRAFDVGQLYWRAGDTEIPDFQTCLDRAGTGLKLQHRAISEAEQVVLLMRMHYQYHAPRNIELSQHHKSFS